MEISIKDIDRLGDDKNIYAFESAKGDVHRVRKDAGKIGKNGEEYIYIQTSSPTTSIHEITHIRQSFDIAGFYYDKDNNYLTFRGSAKRAADNEIEAYKAGYSLYESFPGSSSNINDINYQSVGNLMDSYGNMPYSYMLNLK